MTQDIALVTWVLERFGLLTRPPGDAIDADRAGILVTGGDAVGAELRRDRHRAYWILDEVCADVLRVIEPSGSFAPKELYSLTPLGWVRLEEADQED